LSESPSYGYQLMKRMEEQLAGGYMPSAGVIYPTLTMLEEEGLAVSSTSDGSKRVFTVTPEGQEFLKNNQERISQVVARLKEAGEGFRRRRSPEIMKAFLSLRSAVGARISRETVTQEQIQKIVEAIDTATRTIDGV
jgi:DNA-binding PadR family transcriptional regulator